MNRDAASRHTGTAAFMDLIKARKRWPITRYYRVTIVGKLLKMAVFSNLEEASQKLRPYRIICDNHIAEQVITALRSTMNPLNAEGTDNAKLYHLS